MCLVEIFSTFKPVGYTFVLINRFPDDIEGLFLDVNLRKTKMLLFATHHPPRQHDKYYFQCIGNALDVYSPKYEKYVLVGDLNAEENEAMTKQFLEIYGLKSLVHASTCFKSLNNPSCIDLILTNCYRSFQNTSILSSGLSDCHKMVITVMKTRNIFYRNYKHFDKVTFNDHLLSYLQATPAAHLNFCKFQESFLHVLNIYAPMKKIIRANEMPYMTKPLRKQRNYCNRLYKRERKRFYTNID